MTPEMMTTLVGAIGTVVTGVGGWVVKRHSDTNTLVVDLDKRAAVVEQAFVDLKELINTRFDSSDQRIGRIERSLNGSLHRE